MNTPTNVGAEYARENFQNHRQGAHLAVSTHDDKEIARMNLRGTDGCGIKVIGDLICRVYREQGCYTLTVTAKEHPGFELCSYEASASGPVGMIAMNSLLEQLRADCEWLDSMPEGALLSPGHTVITFLLTYIGGVLMEYTPGEVPERLQRILDKVKEQQSKIQEEGEDPARIAFVTETLARLQEKQRVDRETFVPADLLYSSKKGGIYGRLPT